MNDSFELAATLNFITEAPANRRDKAAEMDKRANFFLSTDYFVMERIKDTKMSGSNGRLRGKHYKEWSNILKT